MSQTTSPYLIVHLFVLIFTATSTRFGGHVCATPFTPGNRYVQPGQSIQSVIDAAHSGDVIYVSAGTYAEQLTIETDGISLVGSGATLTPPATPATNTCSGLAGPNTQAGICVTGSNIVLGPFPGSEHRKVVSVGRAVRHVSIIGFEINGFSGLNIALVGACDTKVTGNKLVDGLTYGLLSDGSINTMARGNEVSSTKGLGFIGMCMDDMATSHFSSNNISGYGVALCVQTPGADVHKNNVKDSCVGVFVDPGVKGAKVVHNVISSHNPACEQDGANGGIFIDGGIDTLVQRNTIQGQANGGHAAGIVIVDDTTTATIQVTSGSTITQNSLSGNDVDIFLNTTGVGNVISNNLCTSSLPAGLCSPH
jgi:nitrous oxidase accessory protein NosD